MPPSKTNLVPEMAEEVVAVGTGLPLRVPTSRSRRNSSSRGDPVSYLRTRYYKTELSLRESELFGSIGVSMFGFGCEKDYQPALLSRNSSGDRVS